MSIEYVFNATGKPVGIYDYASGQSLPIEDEPKKPEPVAVNPKPDAKKEISFWQRYLNVAAAGGKTGGAAACGGEDTGIKDAGGDLQDSGIDAGPGCENILTQITNPLIDENLDDFNTALWHKADGWANGDPFFNGWRADHVFFGGGTMKLQLDNNGCPAGCSGKPYASAEYRSNTNYGYGLLEAGFKSAKSDGIIAASLFFYTGPSDGNPWDEIDIEILGKDTTKMQTNYFTSGQGGHEKIIDLGFDATADFHQYAIKWMPDRICWYVDNKLVHSEDGSHGQLPSHPGKIMMNLWPGTGVDGWLGPFNYTEPLKAEYDWIKYSPTN